MRFVALVLAAIAATVPAACAASEPRVEALGDSCAPLVYEGEGKPQFIVASDLPLRKFHRQDTAPMVTAITRVLRQRGFRAGTYRVGYQSCDDAVGSEPFDEARCVQNANAYVGNAAVLGVIGTYNSGCASLMLPILSRKSAGPLAMVSPANTFLGLTRDGPGTQGYGPARHYPDGVRNYVRLVPADGAQGAAAALAARDRGVRRAVVLGQPRETYSAGVSGAFARAAKRLGIVATTFEWSSNQSFAPLARSVARTRPDAIYLGGLASANGKRLVEDLRRAVAPDVVFLAPDAWAGLAAHLGDAGNGMLVTSSGVPIERLPPRGRELLRAVGAPARGRAYIVEAAQATEVLLDAIARSDGSRASVVEELFRTRVRDGLIGDFGFDPAGDMNPAFFGLYRFTGGKDRFVRLVRARAELVHPER